MKKIISIVIILIVIDLVIVSNDSKSLSNKITFNELKKEKNNTWERIITQVYGRGIKKGKTLLKYKGPILFNLKNAIDKDSLAFNKTLNYLKNLLPNQDIDYFSNYTKKYKITNDSLVNGYPLNFLKPRIIEFVINNQGNEIWSENKFLDVIDKKTFTHFSSSTHIAGYINSKTKFNFTEMISANERAQVFKNVIFKILSANSFHISDDYTTLNISKSDELILQKFYNPNFEKELKKYMESVYGWRYTNHFLDKESYLKKILLIVFSIGIVFFVLIFSYNQNQQFKYEYLNYFSPLLLIAICYTHLNILYKYFTSFNSLISWSEDILKGVTMAVIFSVFTSFMMYNIEKLVFKYSMNFSIKLLLKIIITFIVLNLPFLGYAINYNESVVLKFYWTSLLLWSVLAIGRGILIYLNYFSESLVKQKDVEISNLKALQAQSETKLLQSQINPHFLYNSLNSIASLAKIDAEKTQKMAYSLSDLFKYSINKKDKKTNTIKDEVEMVKTYLEIEKIRFEDRLQFTFDVDISIESKEIPLFLIQPLVENAIKHGVSKNIGQGKINLKIEKKENSIFIAVYDNGPDFPEGLISGHGLQTVYDLLRLNYKDNASLNWTNTPEKMIFIQIPNGY